MAIALPYFTNTRANGIAVITWIAPEGIKPFIGAWYDDSGNWYPCCWTKDGFFDPDKGVTALDIDI